MSTLRVVDPERPDDIDRDSWRCSCGLWRPVTGSFGCADCGDGRPDSWDRAALATPEPAPKSEHGLCCECFDGPNMAAGHEHWGDELP